MFECISMLSIAVGQTMGKYMEEYLDPMFACGLNESLTQALVDMAHYIPPIKPTIQEKLLDLLSHVLCGRPFKPLGHPSHGLPAPAIHARDLKDSQAQEHREGEIALALHTLGSFDFSGKAGPSSRWPLILTGPNMAKLILPAPPVRARSERVRP